MERKNSLSQVFYLGMAAVMMTGSVVGCSSAEDRGKEQTKQEGPLTLEAVALVNALSGDFNQMDILKRISSETGVNVDYECIPGNVWNEKKNLMLASNDLPDLFIGGGLSDSDINKYGPAGMLLPLDDLIQHAPNVSALLEKYPDLKKALTSPDGKIYTLPFYDEFLPENIPDNLFINKTWLDQLGLDIPKTTDEFYEVLKAFKTQDPNGNGKNDEIPFTYRANQVFTGDYSLSGAFGTLDVPDHIILENGKVKFSAIEDGYKEAIKWFEKLYKEGLIDQEIFTQDQSQYVSKGKSEEMIVGAFIIYADENFVGAERAYNDYVVVEPLIGPNGDQKWNRYNYGMYLDHFAITNVNPDPVATMKWVDKFYEEGISIQVHWGEVGKSLEKEGEMYKIIEAPEGMSIDEYRFKTVPAANAPGIMSSEMYEKIDFATDKKKKIERYDLYDPYANKEVMPTIRFTDEELNELTTISTDLNNYVEEMKAKWITGTSDIEKDWEDYKSRLKEMNLERYLQIYQEGYERYK